MKQFLRKSIKILTITAATLILLLLTVILLTQTQVVRSFIVSQIKQTVESSTNATLSIGSIEGNLIGGFVLRDVEIRLHTGTAYDTIPILKAEELIARYSMLRFIRKSELGITGIMLEHPVVHLVRFRGDSLWNFERLQKPSASHTPSSPFTTIVDLQSFRMLNGLLTSRDFNQAELPAPLLTTSIAMPLRRVDWSDLYISAIDLDARLFARGAAAQSLRIDHLSLLDERSGFAIQHLELSAYRDLLQTRIDLAHVITNRSDLRFAASVAPPTILETGSMSSMKNAATSLRLEGPSISSVELQALIPSLNFMAGTPGIDLAASGTWDNLKIEHLNLDFKGKGSLAIAGYMKGLDEPATLNFDVLVTGRDISSGTLQSFVPGLHAPQLATVGSAQIRSIHFVGEPLNFKSTYDLSTQHGDFQGDLALDLRGKQMLYTVKAATDHVDLAALLSQPSLKSDLSLNITLTGRGTDLKTLTSRITVSALRQSSLQNYLVSGLDLSASVEHGVVRSDHITLTVPSGPNLELTKASFDIARSSHPYVATGVVSDFPIGHYVPSMKESAARLNVAFDMAGQGKDIDQLTGTAHAKITNLSLRGQNFKDVTADLRIARGASDSGTVFELRSNLADALLHGSFGVDDLVSVIPARLGTLVTAISNRYFPNELDTSFKVASMEVPVGECDSIDMAFSIKMKDLRPLAAFLPNTMLLATGDVAGVVNGCVNNTLSMRATGNLRSFVLQSRKFANDSAALRPPDSTQSVTTLAQDLLKDSLFTPSTTKEKFALPRIVLTPIQFEIAAAHLSEDPHAVLRDLDAHIAFHADSVIRYNNFLLFHPHVRLDYSSKALRYNLWSVLANRYGIHVVGSADFPEQAFDFTIDTLHVVMDHAYRWFNEGKIRASITESGKVTVDTITFSHLEPGDLKGVFTERLRVAAQISGDSVHYIWASLPSFKMDELPSIIPISRSLRTSAPFDGRVEKLDLLMTGTLQHPAIDANIQIAHLKYQGLAFDTTLGSLHYRNATLSGNVIIHVDSQQFAIDNFGDTHALATLSGKNRLALTIDSIPVLFALKRGPSYAADSAATQRRTMSARLETFHFPIDLAQQFLPAVDQLSGFGDITLTLAGRPSHINFGGQATIVDGGFRVTNTNVFYTFEGGLGFAEQVLSLRHFTVRNTNYDDPSGNANVTGNIKFKGFSIDSINVSATTDGLMVLTPASKSVMRTVSGPLVIRTDGAPLRFSGTLASPLLSGQVAIVRSYLKVQQSDALASNDASSDGIIYRPYIRKPVAITDSAALRSDSSTAKPPIDSTLAESTLDSVLFPVLAQDIYHDDERLTASDSEAIALASEGAKPQPNILDRMRYDLGLSIEGDAWIILTMNRLYGLLGEQLRAEIKTEGLRIERGYNGIYHVSGTLTLAENSSYSFYKTFSPASGTISFRDEPTNPVINIAAEYIGPHGSGEVKIRLLITGTANNPKLAMEIYENKGAGTDFVRRDGIQSDIQEDALYYLVSGSFKSELDQGAQAGVITKAYESLGGQLANSMFNNVLGSSLIRSVNFDYGGSKGPSRLKLTAGYRDLVFRYGNNALNNPLVADYSVEVPFSFFTTSGWARRGFLNFNYHPIDATTGVEVLQQPNYLGKLLWRIPIY